MKANLNELYKIELRRRLSIEKAMIPKIIEQLPRTFLPLTESPARISGTPPTKIEEKKQDRYMFVTLL